MRIYMLQEFINFYFNNVVKISNGFGDHLATMLTSDDGGHIFPLRSDSGFTLEYVRGDSSLGTGCSLFYQPASYGMYY